jgi:hypothetical protein
MCIIRASKSVVANRKRKLTLVSKLGRRWLDKVETSKISRKEMDDLSESFGQMSLAATKEDTDEEDEVEELRELIEALDV